MFIKTSWLAAILVILSVLLSGCATTANFSHTPTDASEFTKNLAALKQNYADIEAYDRRFAGLSSCPPESDLEKMWGKPTTKKKWGEFAVDLGVGLGFVAAGYLTYPTLAIVYLLSPIPREEYVWEKGNYEITAYGRSDALFYGKRVLGWKWEEKSPAEGVAYNAQNGR